MPRPARPLLAALLAACGSAAPTASPAPAAEASPPTWRQTMAAVDAIGKAIEAELQKAAFGDQKHIAALARDGGALMARGYGSQEQRAIPGFAGLARGAESWFLQLGIDASQGHGDLVAQQWQAGSTIHCVRCHDAADRAGVPRKRAR
jgi:hypothetical protein